MMSSFKRMSQRDNHNLVLRDGNHKNNQVDKTVPLLSIIFVLSLRRDEIYRGNVLPLMNSNFDSRVAN